MIQDICEGMAYIVVLNDEPKFVIVNGKIQYDIDFLGRKRTTIKLDDNSYRLVSKLNSHRLELDDIQGEVYKNLSYLAVWYPKNEKHKDISKLIDYLMSEIYSLLDFIDHHEFMIDYISSILDKISFYTNNKRL